MYLVYTWSFIHNTCPTAVHVPCAGTVTVTVIRGAEQKLVDAEGLMVGELVRAEYLKVFVGCCDDELVALEVLVVVNLLLKLKGLLLDICEEKLPELDLLLVVIVEVLEEVLDFAELEPVDVTVQAQVIDGTASTPFPIATMLVPQFAACARSTLALSWSYTTGSHQHIHGLLEESSLLYADLRNESIVRAID